MSMFRRAYTTPRQQRIFQGVTPDWTGTIPNRSGQNRHGSIVVTEDRAMRHSAVWACIRIRADLMSTFPVGVFRDFDGLALEMPKPPIMVDPGGLEWDFVDWMWASQRDLDLSGNVIGVITARNGIQTPYYPQGLPAVIELADTRSASVIWHKGKKQYRVNGKVYEAWEVYHEKQYPLSGMPVGASPLIYAASTIGEYLSLQQYGLDWFGAGGVPKAWMKNTVKRLGETERDNAKSWYRDTISNGDLMVTGNDWEYNMIQAEQAGLEWLEGRRFGLVEIARFFGVPADLIDSAISGQSVTYANITQRNLQFLIMNLGPAIIKREKTLTKLLPQPRYVKLNTDALLRMDPATRQQMIRDRLETWQITNTEARALEEMPPLTPEQRAEMIDIYGRPAAGASSLPADMGSPLTKDKATVKEGGYPAPEPPPPPPPPAPVLPPGQQPPAPGAPPEPDQKAPTGA